MTLETRVLVCGSRTFTDDRIVTSVLGGLFNQTKHEGNGYGVFAVIEGGANGADTLARNWVLRQTRDDLTHREYPANWRQHGKAAGPVRNQQMLDEEDPHWVVAFVDKPLRESRGTADMVRRAKAAGVPVYVIEAS